MRDNGDPSWTADPSTVGWKRRRPSKLAAPARSTIRTSRSVGSHRPTED